MESFVIPPAALSRDSSPMKDELLFLLLFFFNTEKDSASSAIAAPLETNLFGAETGLMEPVGFVNSALNYVL